jgi:hypothetical protein
MGAFLINDNGENNAIIFINGPRACDKHRLTRTTLTIVRLPHLGLASLLIHLSYSVKEHALHTFKVLAKPTN